MTVEIIGDENGGHTHFLPEDRVTNANPASLNQSIQRKPSEHQLLNGLNLFDIKLVRVRLSPERVLCQAPDRCKNENRFLLRLFTVFLRFGAFCFAVLRGLPLQY
jgi:hypothetical protein